VSEPAAGPRPRVAVLADDLICATRLADVVRRVGGHPVPVRALPALYEVLPSVAGCIVDLTSRAYDGIAAIEAAALAGARVIAVGQHDDAVVRGAARSAGAERVFAYRALFEQGDRALGAWIATLAPSGDAR
jgi:hypothetical protein